MLDNLNFVVSVLSFFKSVCSVCRESRYVETWSRQHWQRQLTSHVRFVKLQMVRERKLPQWFAWSEQWCCSCLERNLKCMFEVLQAVVCLWTPTFVCVQDLSLRGRWGQSTDHAMPLHRQPAFRAPGLSAAVDQELRHTLLWALQVRVYHGDQTKAVTQGKHAYTHKYSLTWSCSVQRAWETHQYPVTLNSLFLFVLIT